MLVADLLESGVLLDLPQPGEIVRHLPLEAGGRRREQASLLDGAYFPKSQRMTLDGRGSMAIAGPGIFLKRGNPRQPDRRSENTLPQGSDLFNERKQRRRDRNAGLVSRR